MKQTVRLAGGINELFGTLDENLKLFESALHVTTHLRDHDLEIEGSQPQVERAAQILGEYNQRIRDGRIPDSSEVKSLLRIATGATSEPGASVRGAFALSNTRSFGKKTITPKSANQKRYMEALEAYDMVFAIGPGGTGKTYLAVAMAVTALLSKQVNRIILARPAVEAGERLGFLPGTLQEKVDPYMRPLYDALHDLLEADKLESFLEKGIIEVAPLAFMRGRTLNESRRSGLIEAVEIVGKIEGISFTYFDERDVVRHNLVQRIIKAYDEHAASHPHHNGRGAGHVGHSGPQNPRD
jgi:phosphate starvation-inducible PhoH-like protein